MMLTIPDRHGRLAPVTVIVGVDVGGSGLRLQCRYAEGPGPVLTAPGVRVGAGGIDVAALARDALSLLASAQVSGPDVVVWSMRGLLFLADRQEVLDQVRAGLGARRTIVVSDAVANLVGAVGGVRAGAVVAAGTGAVAFGSDFDGHWNRVDGWGHVLGDYGSAAVLGLEGLRAGLRHYDGLPAGSAALLSLGQTRFGPPEGWPRRVMTGANAPEVLAGFAPDVTAAAADDGVARSLCEAAGASLAVSLLAAAAGLGAPVLTATGGLLASGVVSSALDARLAEGGALRVAAQGSALDGALELGRHLLEAGSLPEHPAYLLVA
jgi:N-acetylglucosamine kinase-like BadF-type ATPase